MKSAQSPFQAIVKLLLRWWWLILLSVALGGGAGYLVRAQQPNIYFAKTTILFGQNFTTGASANQTSLTQLRDMMTIYSGLVRRPNILEPVIDELRLGIGVDQLNEVMSVNTVQNLPLMEITIADTDPARASNIANRIAQELIIQSPTEQVSQETEFRRAQLRDLQKQIEELQREYDSKVALGANFTSAFEIAQNLNERASILGNLKELRLIYAEMSSGLADQVNFLRIYEFANPDALPVVTSSILSVVLAGLGGLMLSVATIVLIAYFDDRLQWYDGLETVQGVKVLGPLGLVKRSKLPLYTAAAPESIESEVLRQLRAKIVLAAGGIPPKVLTITSYDSGDGKTVTAANLGVVSANSGLRTLLIDGDIRKGDLHEIFRLPNVMGLSDILTSHGDLAEMLSRALLDSGYSNLTVLPSGRSNADPASLLAGPRLAQMMDILKTQFDCIIMDSVPSIGGPDAAFMAEVSDGVLIVVDSRRTTEKALKRTLQTLQQARRLSVYGIAFNRIALEATSTHHQPYYRRTLTLSQERLQRELMGSKSLRARLGLSRNVLVRQGERLYSLKACALQLGITEETLRHWIKVGYLKTERRGGRHWVSEQAIQTMLDNMPRFSIQLPGLPPELMAEANGATSAGASALPSRLRDQRNALLGLVGDSTQTPLASEQPEEPSEETP